MIKKNQNKTTKSSKKNIGRKQPTSAGKMATPKVIALLLLD